MYFGIVLFLDVLLLIKKRAPPPLPKMADVSAEEKVSLKWFLDLAILISYFINELQKDCCGLLFLSVEANTAS